MKNKIELLQNYNIGHKSIGSTSAQIIFLKEKTNVLINHLRKNHKDVPAKRSMLKCLAKQRRLLLQLKKSDYDFFVSFDSILQKEKKEKKTLKQL